jgi:hypothetical protein
VILTFDPDSLPRYGLAAYAPEVIAAECRRQPPIAKLVDLLGPGTSVRSIPIPADCVDGFKEVYLARPERFLDGRVRQAQSSWGFVEVDVRDRVLQRPRADLASGAWDARHGSHRSLSAYDGSLRLVGAPAKRD